PQWGWWWSPAWQPALQPRYTRRARPLGGSPTLQQGLAIAQECLPPSGRSRPWSGPQGSPGPATHRGSSPRFLQGALEGPPQLGCAYSRRSRRYAASSSLAGHGQRTTPPGGLG